MTTPSLRHIRLTWMVIGVLLSADAALGQGMFLPYGQSGAGGEVGVIFRDRATNGLGGEIGFSYRGLVDLSLGGTVMRSLTANTHGEALSVAIYPSRFLLKNSNGGIVLAGSLGLQSKNSFPPQSSTKGALGHGSVTTRAFVVGGYLT